MPVPPTYSRHFVERQRRFDEPDYVVPAFPPLVVDGPRPRVEDGIEGADYVVARYVEHDAHALIKHTSCEESRTMPTVAMLDDVLHDCGRCNRASAAHSRLQLVHGLELFGLKK
ncbi:unnamed protein product [Rangifer tarandus platyrhynchus]|uniref:Uncharacterized protein n=1 Tax=Rangifer tarandus platyrhynchus TaxID=3082113 RepID=A0ABN8XIN1_RANTA|nr:unnamed protein product [Rangifer tarandus platyrhynchus]